MAGTPKAPGTQRVYDACVVGPQLAGAVAGALLARRGRRVLLVDGPGGSYEEDGWLLPQAPAVLPPLRLLPAAEAVLEELALVNDLSRALEPSRPDLQVVLPRARFELARDPGRRAAELRREWPADADRLGAAFDELARLFDEANPFLRAVPPLPPGSLAERWALSRLLRAAARAPGALGPPGATPPFRGVEEHPLVRALEAGARLLGHLDGDLPPLARVRLLGALARGAHRLPLGVESLREMVRRRIAESRGEILGGSAEALEIDGRRVAAVRVAGSRDAFVGRVFLLAAEPAEVRRLLPEAERGHRRARLLERMRPGRRLATVNFLLRAEGLPPGLGEAALVPGAPPGEPPSAVLLQVLQARRAPGIPAPAESLRVLCAAGVAAAGEAGAGFAGRIREALLGPLPFFDRHVVLESVAPRPAHPLYRVDLARTLGVSGLPVRSPWKNALFAGREVLPGLGLEGEFHAGLQAARAAEKLLGARRG